MLKIEVTRQPYGEWRACTLPLARVGSSEVVIVGPDPAYHMQLSIQHWAYDLTET